MTGRLCFLSQFVIMLAIGAAGFFAVINGVPQAIFSADQSMATSVIAALFVGTTVYTSALAWNVGPDTSSGFGHLAVRLSVLIGITGTSIGLSLQAHSLVGGAAQFGPLATSLYTVFTGGIAAILIEIQTHNLEAGIRRASR
jgi:hypothetical protein